MRRKVVVYNTEDMVTVVEFKVSNYISLTSTTYQFEIHDEDMIRDYCTDTAENMSLDWFIENPDNSFNDLVSYLMVNYEHNSDFEDMRYNEDRELEVWNFYSGGQSHTNVPEDLIELWDLHHLEPTTDDAVSAINDVLDRFEKEVNQEWGF